MQAGSRRSGRARRHNRVRKKIFGTATRPRLAVFRSSRHIYAQVIDDSAATTLVAASTLDPSIRSTMAGKEKTELSSEVGRLLAERARAVGIEEVVFDRGGYKYHGRVAALAEAAREGGLKF